MQNANVTIKKEKLICARCKRSNQNERYSCTRDERNKQSKERLNLHKIQWNDQDERTVEFARDTNVTIKK